jgi:hypothetical protein
MADIDPNAEYHRTLDGSLAAVPYLYYEVRNEAFRKAGARTAYVIRDNTFAPIMYLQKKDQEFNKYATDWELKHSRIPFGDGHGKVDPVVDENMTVIGHLGTFNGKEIYVPRKQPTMRNPAATWNANAPTPINTLLRWRFDVVAYSWSAGALPQAYRDYVEYTTSDDQYQVLTDIEGHVMSMVRHTSREALIPSTFSPLDLISIGRLVVMGLAALTTALVVRTIARRIAAKALQSAVKRELTSGTKIIEEKFNEEFWKKIIQGNPPAVRLGRMGEAGNLFARVDVVEGKVIYRVGAIVLKGEGEVAEIELARAAHREMIRRAAKQAQDKGLKQFELRGIDANANFRAHADRLAREIGVPNSGKMLAGSAPGFSSYEVTIDVAKALAGSAKTAAKVVK